MPGSYSYIDTLVPITQQRIFGDINSNGEIALPFNETQVIQVIVVLAVLVVIAVILSQLGLFSIPEIFAQKSQKRFDHMMGPEHQGFRPEHPEMESRYRRGVNDIASKMAQLEQAFKKYQVTEAECEMYIACEASQVNRHEENGPLAKIIFDIISTFNRAKDGHKWDDRMEGLVQAFEYGTGAQAAGQVDACEPLRNKCFELHASTKY
jgi:hypothetical protein